MISIKNITVKKSDFILRDLSLELDKNVVYGVIGNSGAGKSTLLNAISGNLDLESGSIEFFEHKVIGPSEKLIPGVDGIEYVFQDFGLEKFHTVAENIKEKILHLKRDEQVSKVESYLDLVELRHVKDVQARFISGGEKQRLSIARALASSPSLLLLDEPFVHIDQKLKWKIQNHIKELVSNKDLSIIIVSHDSSELLGFCDYLVFLRNKKIEDFRMTDNVFYEPIDQSEGELLGFINKVVIGDEEVLFRPNQVDINPVNAGIPVRFESYIDTGVSILNFFTTLKNEKIVISSDSILKNLECFGVKK